MKLAKACLAVAMFAALFVMPSIASAIQLTRPTGTTAAVGTRLLGTSVAHSFTPQTTILKTGVGNIECETATLTGELTKNEANGTAIEGNITTAEFLGYPEAKPDGISCAGGFSGNTTVTPNHLVNQCHTPFGGLIACSLPWCMKVASENAFTVRGGKCSEPSRPLTFTLHTSTIGSCSYQKATVTGTYTTHPDDAIGTVSGQTFTKITGSVFCPNSGELFMAFIVVAENLINERTFIDKT